MGKIIVFTHLKSSVILQREIKKAMQ